jgi:hypothetical protein
VTDGAILRYADGAWTAVDTLHAGVAAMFQTNPTALGDYAIVTGGPTGGGVDIALILAGLGIALIFVAFVGLMVVRARPPAAYPTRADRGGSRARIPSKRRGSRPSSGRSDR